MTLNNNYIEINKNSNYAPKKYQTNIYFKVKHMHKHTL